MAERVAVTHSTIYEYDKTVRLSPQVIRLRPAPHTRTVIEAYTLKIDPSECFINELQDPYGNYESRVFIPHPVKLFSITVELILNLTAINPLDFFVEDYARKYPFSYDQEIKEDLSGYLQPTERGPLLLAFVESVRRDSVASVDYLVELNQRLVREIKYTVRYEPGIYTSDETLQYAEGSCRDSSWLFVQMLRHLGFAARFVSGYLVQLAPDEILLEDKGKNFFDFTDLHAWVEVYIPGAGWIGLDPTSGLFAGEGHIPLACTPSPQSAAPITGSSEKAECRFSYNNVVNRLSSTNKTAKPYTDYQWALIEETGSHVDERLESNGVQLTCGGEPTFVSAHDFYSAQWNTDALGKQKKIMALSLLSRLWARFGRGGITFHGQGKWYPGEPLPRWALSIFWKKDGSVIWSDAALLGNEVEKYHKSNDDARQLMAGLCRRLRLSERFVHATYEDILYYSWAEANMPLYEKPEEIDYNQPNERQSLRKKLESGIGNPCGYVLPLHWDEHTRLWRSCTWELERGYLWLLPGDSSIGYRLPLTSLSHKESHIVEAPIQISLYDQLHSLPSGVNTRVSSVQEEQAGQQVLQADDFNQLIKTALCIQQREGRIYIFMPPVAAYDQYEELLRAIEDASKEQNCPVLLEGYEPPRDNRIHKLSITPDPGVIEVNIHPAADWNELSTNVSVLYEQAREVGLTAEKYLLDGRPCGTGGGNHITFGGPYPWASPFLRRPDLLASVINFWQHHPSLSYLFSGLFIGPTSQAPRPDEARSDILYELEIAMNHARVGEQPQPWLVDRLFRHFLVDVTGNTHRSEICIDKLYSPDSDMGRLGLVEFRAFEMPPHPRLMLAQILLLRALIVSFWEKPYRYPLVRWGTALHDRFMLPYYIFEDFKDILAYLDQCNLKFDLDWYIPFYEYRFPKLGELLVGDIHIELRNALEPWYVLGEEQAGGGGTTRFVDSSVERLQIKVDGLVGERYVLSCQGRRIPLVATGVYGQHVAGVRFKAWQPASALHPTIDFHSQLVFDVIDTWNGRAVGGCTYHVSHPGGRSYEVNPINTLEAESRRHTRFWGYGHTPGPIPLPRKWAGAGRVVAQGTGIGPMGVPAEELSREFPSTLDLRMPPRYPGEQPLKA